jgi:hypothetical protein
VVENLENAFPGHRQTNVALIGNSHGGGDVYNISAIWNSIEVGQASLTTTVYIDAISNMGTFDTRSERRRPKNTEFHANIYQTNEELSDQRLIGASTTINGTANEEFHVTLTNPLIHHTLIDDTEFVQDWVVSIILSEEAQR